MAGPLACRFVVFLALLVGFARSETTYYISPEGNDSNDGKTEATPWRTLSSLQTQPALAATTSSPVNILLRRNATYSNDPFRLSLSKIFARVEVGAYGDPKEPRPLLQQIRGLNDLSAACMIVSDISKYGLLIDNLHMGGCAQGLVLKGSTIDIATDVLVSNSIFQDIRTPLLRYTPPNPQWASAISLESGTFQNLTITNNVAARIDVFFNSLAYTNIMHLNGNTVQQCSGNCYSFGRGVDLTMENSVLLRDMSTRLFMYGTTDVIVGGLDGNNQVVNNDFNQRGEYQGGPDGCAFDFETAATGFLVSGNTFSRSWGAGIMIFGHAITSQNITISDNIFDHSGCVQNRDDRGGIAVMCPNGQRPSGLLKDNSFFTEPGCPAIFVNPSVKDCDGNLKQIGNVVNGNQKMVVMPQLSFNPPSPLTKLTNGSLNVIAVTTTPGASIRFTLDGSRPTHASRLMPKNGIELPWPGPATNVNVRAFKSGMLGSITNGALVPLNYGLGRMAPNAADAGPGGAAIGKLNGNLDSVVKNIASGEVIVSGWAVDTLASGGGTSPVTIVASVDYKPTLAVLATQNRPDLPKAGVAPDPYHGFTLTLPEAASKKLLSAGEHILIVKAIGTPSSAVPKLLPGVSFKRCIDGKCA